MAACPSSARIRLVASLASLAPIAPAVRAATADAGAADAASPALQQQVDRRAAQVIAQLPPMGSDSCLAAVSISRTDDARFASSGLLAEGPASSSAPPSVSSVPAAAPPPRVMPSRPAAGQGSMSALGEDVLARIEGFAFGTRAGIGYGGMVTLEVYPIVMFRNGDALQDVAALAFPGGLEAHRRERPEAWTQWRREAGELQTRAESGWKKLPFQVLYAKLPDDFRLDGSYRRLGGAGTLAVGGTSAVAAWSEYRFSRDGRVARRGGAGARADSGGTSVTTGSQSPLRSGRYRVTGLVLRLDFDDGSVERMVLITDPADPRGAIWLDGVGYAQRRG